MGMTLQIKGSLNYAFSSDSRGDSIWDKASGLALQCGSGTKDIFKIFFLWRNFCRGKNKTNKKKSTTTKATWQQQTQTHNNFDGIFKCSYSNKKKRWEEKGEENFSRLLQDGDYLCFKDRNLIYVEIHAIWTKITFSKHLLDWKRSYLFSRLINPMSLATLKYSGQARGLYLLRQIWVKNSWFPCLHAAL